MGGNKDPAEIRMFILSLDESLAANLTTATTKVHSAHRNIKENIASNGISISDMKELVEEEKLPLPFINKLLT